MRKIYNKLVRDKMVEVYEHDVAHKVSASGYSAHTLTREETLVYLKDKLQEEVEEVYAAYEDPNTSHLKEELADVIEVIDAILHHHNIPFAEVLALRDAKKAQKGGFEKGVFLEYIDYLD